MKKIFLLLFLSSFVVPGYSQSTVTVSLAGVGAWQVPCGITSITVNCWGGGGAGGTAGNKAFAGGGGGGGYSTVTLAVTAGSSINYTVGAGGTSNSSAGNGGTGEATTFSTTTAGGGVGGLGGTGSGGGTSFLGGTFGSGTLAAGNGVAGGNGNSGANTGGNGGNAGTGGGFGGTGGTAGNPGTGGNLPGGGGGGGADGSGTAVNLPTGGSGGDGQINIIYTLPIAVNAGTDITMGLCTTTATNLAATAIPAGWTGSWSCSGAGCSSIVISTPASNNTSVAGAGFTPGSTTTFIWTVTNGICSYQSQMIVSVPACAQNNPVCGSAQPLPVNNSLLCGQNTNGFVGAADGCVISGTGQTVWYSFTTSASTTPLVLNVLGTAAPYPNYGVFNGVCAGLTCGQIVTFSLSAGDPGKHTLLTGLAPNTTYYVQVQSSTTANSKFCISINDVAANSTSPANAQVISSCGTTFNGTTNGGYYPSGSGAGHNNLDVAPTTCTACPTAGQDVTFVINNISWFKFCSVNTGTYNVQFNVSSCVFTGLNSGSQMAVLTGATNSLTNIWQATNPTYPTTPTQASPNFALAAGGCAYLIVDGFAGDACSYNYVLTNVSGGCALLPIELTMFNAHLNGNSVDLTWATATEINNDYFTVERSADGVNFESIGLVKGAGNSVKEVYYYLQDRKPLTGISYYRLKQTDFDKKETYSVIQSISIDVENTFDFMLFPNPSDKNEDVRLIFNGKENDVLNLSITDITGKLLSEKTIKLSAPSLEVNLKHHFDAGIYFVKVSNKDGKIINQKFVVQ